MLLFGYGGYNAHKDFEDDMTFIGNFKNPIMWIKKGEIPKRLDPEFYYFHELWKLFNNGIRPSEMEGVESLLSEMSDVQKFVEHKNEVDKFNALISFLKNLGKGLGVKWQ